MDEKEIMQAYNQGLNAVITLVQDMHKSLSEQIEVLNQRITELEARLNKNSSNSGKPPYSDGY